MKASELRIGNFVYDQNIKYKTDNGYTEILAKGIYLYNLNELKLSPIPLTEEWLVRFGFELYDYKLALDEYDKSYDQNNVDVMAYKKQVTKHIYYSIANSCIRDEWQFVINRGNDNDSFLLSNIKFVHQLQNLYFALTHEELEFQKG